MGKPAHKQDTKTFPELSFADQARSINAMINNLANCMKHHSRHSRSPVATRQKCINQVQRLLGRL